MHANGRDLFWRLGFLVAIALLAWRAGQAGALGGEAPSPAPAAKPDPAKVKAARIERLTKVVASMENGLRFWTPERIAAQIKTDAENGKESGEGREMESSRARTVESLPKFRVELAWLKGELIVAGAEAAVQIAQDSAEKAPEADKPAAQKRLDEAKRVLEQVRALDEKARQGEF